jgi:hypothetical protein
MRLARKSILLAAVAATALALTAGSTSAQESPKGAYTEEISPCGTVTLVGHDAQGGCHVEFRNTGNGIPLHVYIPSKTTISNCTVHLEGQIGTNGEGYFDEITLTPPTGGGFPCTRTECDEAEGGTNPHADIPWPFHFVEHDSGEEEVEATFCLRASNTTEGTAGSKCEIHLKTTDLGDHDYEIGQADQDNGTEAHCENNPPNITGHPALPFPTSIEAHLTTVGTSESGRFELVH